MCKSSFLSPQLIRLYLFLRPWICRGKRLQIFWTISNKKGHCEQQQGRRSRTQWLFLLNTVYTFYEIFLHFKAVKLIFSGLKLSYKYWGFFLSNYNLRNYIPLYVFQMMYRVSVYKKRTNIIFGQILTI